MTNKTKSEKKGKIYCPTDEWTCPYYNANGCCTMYPDADPIDECDDFAYFWNKGDNYVIKED